MLSFMFSFSAYKRRKNKGERFLTMWKMLLRSSPRPPPRSIFLEEGGVSNTLKNNE